MKLLIIDGSYLLYRNLHVESIARLETENGVKTGGLYGVINAILKMACQVEPDKVVCCFDGGRSRRRLALYPEYKKDRQMNYEKLTEDAKREADGLRNLFEDSKKLVEEVLPKFGVKVLCISHREGDDLIALTKALHPNDFSYVMSDDSDLLQLVDDNCTVIRPMKNEEVNTKNFFEVTKCRTAFEVILWKAIEGKHDNLESIPDVSGGSVAKAFSSYGKPIAEHKLDDFYCFCLQEENSTRIKKIPEYQELIKRNLLLAKIGLESFSINDIALIQSILFDPDVVYNDLEVLPLIGKYELNSLNKYARYWQPVLERLV